MFAQIENPNVILVNKTVFYATDGQTESLAFHVKGKKNAAMIFVTSASRGNVTLLTGLRWQPAPLDLTQMYPFTLKNKSNFQKAVLGAAIAIPIFILLTVFACVKSRMLKKWLWVPFILIGLTKLSVLWVDPIPGQPLYSI